MSFTTERPHPPMPARALARPKTRAAGRIPVRVLAICGVAALVAVFAIVGVSRALKKDPEEMRAAWRADVLAAIESGDIDAAAQGISEGGAIWRPDDRTDFLQRVKNVLEAPKNADEAPRGGSPEDAKEAPGAAGDWREETAQINAALDIAVGALDANPSDEGVRKNVAKVLRVARHLLIVRDLGECAKQSGDDAFLSNRLAHVPTATALYTFMNPRLRLFDWSRYGGGGEPSPEQFAPIERVCRAFPAHDDADRGFFEPDEHALIEEIAGFYYLQGDQAGAYERCADALLLEPKGAPSGRARTSETPEECYRRHAWMAYLEPKLQSAARERVTRERTRLESGPSVDAVERLLLGANADLAVGAGDRAYIKATRAMKALQLAPGEALKSFPRSVCVLVLLRACLAEGRGRVEPPSSAAAGKEMQASLLLDLGRLYLEAQKPAVVPELIEKLKVMSGPLAQEGAKLLKAAERGDRAELRALLARLPAGERLLARPVWEALASEKAAPARPLQETLLAIAQVLDALDTFDATRRAELMDGVLSELANHKESDADDIYITYVEALTLIQRGAWGGAVDKLELLHKRYTEYRTGHGRDAAGLSLASVAPLYRLAVQQNSEWERRQGFLQEASALFDRLLLDADPKYPPHEGILAGMALARAMFARGMVESGNAVVHRFAPLWDTEARRGPDVHLEREFILLVDAMRAALEDSLGVIRREEDRPFDAADALLANLRSLLGNRAAFGTLEASVCEREAERLLGLRKGLSVANELRRAELRARARTLCIRAAKCMELQKESAMRVGELYLLAGVGDDETYANAVKYLTLARTRSRSIDEYIRASVRIGEAHMQAGRWKEAYEEFAKFTGVDTGERAAMSIPIRDRQFQPYLDALFYQGRSLCALDRYAEALALFEIVHDYLPDQNLKWRENLYWYGKTLLVMGTAGAAPDREKIGRAVTMLRSLLVRFPPPRGTGIDEPRESGVDLIELAQWHLGEALRGLATDDTGRVEAAREFQALGQRLLQDTARITSARKDLGGRCIWSAADLLFDAGKWYEAQGLYEELVKVYPYFVTSPMQVWAYYQLGACAAHLGNLEEAKGHLDSGAAFLEVSSDQDLARCLPGGDEVKRFWRERFAQRRSDLDAGARAAFGGAREGATP